MTAYFISGSGTDIGKTHLTELILRHEIGRGRTARAFKPVASGVAKIGQPEFEASDTARILRAQGGELNEDVVACITPWRFAAPLSPDMAAAKEGKILAFEDLVQWVRPRLAHSSDGLTLVEGVGGVMSPICSDACNLDLICALGLETVLVCGSYLGAISHCLTAVEALKARRAPIRVIVINESATSTVELSATVETVRRYAPKIPVVALRYGADHLPPDIAKSLTASDAHDFA